MGGPSQIDDTLMDGDVLGDDMIGMKVGSLLESTRRYG